MYVGVGFEQCGQNVVLLETCETEFLAWAHMLQQSRRSQYICTL